MSDQTQRTRCSLLLDVFAPDRLPPAPGVALRVYAAAEAPDCDPAALAALLAADPALQGKRI